MDLPVVTETTNSPRKGGCSAGSRGSTDDQLNHLSDDIRRKVQDHPCYLRKTHHYCPHARGGGASLQHPVPLLRLQVRLRQRVASRRRFRSC